MNAPATENPTFFRPFNKMPRLNREVTITEKIDGTNAQIVIVNHLLFAQCVAEHMRLGEDAPYIATAAHVVAQQGENVMLVGSRTRWIRPKHPGEKCDPDNYGFAAWAQLNNHELFKLGTGTHFGEWYGSGINRAYGLTNGVRRFALFNTERWLPSSSEGLPGVYQATEDGDAEGPNCCYVVPIIWRGCFDTFDPIALVEMLRSHGSFAVRGFMKPEGIVIFHSAANQCFKVTLENDASPKSLPGLTNPKQLLAGREASQHVFEMKCAEGCVGPETPPS